MLNIENLNQEKFIKMNNLKEVTNTMLLQGNKEPTEDGLLSYEIFGHSVKERKSTFGYIDLGADFIHPQIYMILKSYDGKFARIANGTNKYIIKANGTLEESENGNTGLSWLVNNLKNIKFTKGDSDRKNLMVDAIKDYQDSRLKCRKYIVIPPSFRDIDTSKGFISVGIVNDYYTRLISLSRAIKNDAVFDDNMLDNIKFNIQELMATITKHFLDGTEESGTGDAIRGKKGLINNAMLRKSVKFSSRLVLSQAKPDAEHWSEMETSVDNAVIPLASAATQLYPIVLHNMVSIANNLFSNNQVIMVKRGEKKEAMNVSLEEKNQILTQEFLSKKLNLFITSDSNRYNPVRVYAFDDKKNKDVLVTPMIKIVTKSGETVERSLTWCDIVYQATYMCSKDRSTMSTRYPMDTHYNQLVLSMKLGSTIKKLHNVIIRDNDEYDSYPDIREDEVGKHTGNKFKETMAISNALLDQIGGDYDGDTSNNKTPLSKESNTELNKFIKSKRRSIDLGGNIVYGISQESLLVTYTITKKPNIDTVKLTSPQF